MAIAPLEFLLSSHIMVLSTRVPSWFDGRVTQSDLSTVQNCSGNWICAPLLSSRGIRSRNLFFEFLPTMRGYKWHVAVNNLDWANCFVISCVRLRHCLGRPGLLTTTHICTSAGPICDGSSHHTPAGRSSPTVTPITWKKRNCLSSGGRRCNNYVSMTGDIFVKKHVPLELLFLLMSCHAKRFQEGGVFLL